MKIGVRKVGSEVVGFCAVVFAQGGGKEEMINWLRKAIIGGSGVVVGNVEGGHWEWESRRGGG